MRRVLLLLCAILPNPLKIALYRALGFRIGKNVRIGISYINARSVEIGDDSHIGHFNSFRDLNLLSVGKGVYIRNFNEASGLTDDVMWPAEFVIEDGVQIMSRHFFDCPGRILLEEKALIGGRETQLWTHGRNMIPDGSVALQPGSVRVGRNVYVGARCTLVGCTVPDGATVAAASVVVKQHPPEPFSVLLAGNPAVVKKRYETHPVPPRLEADPLPAAG